MSQEAKNVTEKCLEVLLEQENVLRYEEKFGSKEALELGNAVAELAAAYEMGSVVAIVRESDEMLLFEYAMDDKAPRNYKFLRGKRNAALKMGHCSLWAYVEHELYGKWQDIYDHQPEYVPTGGAFPIRVKDEWVATMIISGLKDGKDHELLIRALCKVLGKTVPEFPGVAV